jgi:hypothetical protein
MKTFKLTNNNLTITLNNSEIYNRLDNSPLSETDFNTFIIYNNHKFYLLKK